MPYNAQQESTQPEVFFWKKVPVSSKYSPIPAVRFQR